jgi:hypothetical protein
MNDKKPNIQMPDGREVKVILLRRGLQALEDGVSSIPECCPIHREASYVALNEQADQLQGLSVVLLTLENPEMADLRKRFARVLNTLRHHQHSYLAGMN